jgi:hypothetical protein
MINLLCVIDRRFASKINTQWQGAAVSSPLQQNEGGLETALLVLNWQAKRLLYNF